eukprot:1138736-Pelagomonas_calceolata.AAC.2
MQAPECESKESVYESRRACDLLQLNGIVRVAVCLIKGVEFKIHGGECPLRFQLLARPQCGLEKDAHTRGAAPGSQSSSGLHCGLLR